MADNVIYDLESKDSEDRLRKELKVAQDHSIKTIWKNAILKGFLPAIIAHAVSLVIVVLWLSQVLRGQEINATLDFIAKMALGAYIAIIGGKSLSR